MDTDTALHTLIYVIELLAILVIAGLGVHLALLGHFTYKENRKIAWKLMIAGMIIGEGGGFLALWIVLKKGGG